jgi:3-hydroxybutyryl-CoA dehydrogenase
MTEQTIQSVFVLGSGTMGAGIAEVAIKAGADAILADVHDDLVQRGVHAIEKGKLSADDAAAARARLSTATELAFAGEADLVVEARTRRASRSPSSAARIGAPERTVGLHFFNPPPVMELLEIVRGLEHERDDDRALPRVRETHRQDADRRERDVPGFATSRLGVILGAEAMRMLESGVASSPTSIARWSSATATRWARSS